MVRAIIKVFLSRSSILQHLVKEIQEIRVRCCCSCFSLLIICILQDAVLGSFAVICNAVFDRIRSRIEDALTSISAVDYDRNRLEQEMIYYIEKLDISEEKQRLANHLKYFRDTMADGEAQGKKLGFIAQEMGREINTTGSKSNQAEMQNIVVMMKDELEQIKEQVLNVL